MLMATLLLKLLYLRVLLLSLTMIVMKYIIQAKKPIGLKPLNHRLCMNIDGSTYK